MKEFKFKLNKVLEVKDVEFRQQQRDLVSATRQKSVAFHKLREKQYSVESYADYLENAPAQRAGELRQHYEHYHFLLEDCKSQEQHVLNLEEIESREREKLLQVQKERKILEKLREKELTQFRESYARQAQNALDEMALIQARRIAR